jgi:hypothetical protein
MSTPSDGVEGGIHGCRFRGISEGVVGMISLQLIRGVAHLGDTAGNDVPRVGTDSALVMTIAGHDTIVRATLSAVPVGQSELLTISDSIGRETMPEDVGEYRSSEETDVDVTVTGFYEGVRDDQHPEMAIVHPCISHYQFRYVRKTVIETLPRANDDRADRFDTALRAVTIRHNRTPLSGDLTNKFVYMRYIAK